MTTTTTYIAVHHETGNVCGTETSDENQAWLEALADAFGGTLEFRRDDGKFMEIFDGESACFSAMSLKDDDRAAQDECISRALKTCDQSGGTRGRGVLEIVRDADGEIVLIDPSTTDEPADPALLAYWGARL